ncbi:MAG: hypothetical protein GXP25_23475 [Planctomycetes bacterium]|nr:hypothetical protein [Planctomycetota bacterium]
MSQLMDFVDIHFYYDHCHFPSAPHQGEWTYRNVPMVENPSETIISAIAEARTAGKPFTISEYGPNPFNQYSIVESAAIAGAYAALQDIDGVFLFQYYRGYKDFRDDMEPDRLTGVHNILGDTRAEALMGLSANLFRRGDVRAAVRCVRIPVSDKNCFDQFYKGTNFRSLRMWLEKSGAIKDQNQETFDVRMGLISRVELEHSNGERSYSFPPLPMAQRDPLTGNRATIYKSDTGELRWVHCASKGRSTFCIETERTKVVVGYLDREVSLNGVTIRGKGGKGQFGIVSLTSLDGNPIRQSRNLLVCALGGRGKSRNVNVVEVDPVKKLYRLMGANHLAFYAKGAGPFEIETNPVEIHLPHAARSITVKRLTTDGTALSETILQNHNGAFEFPIGGPTDHTPWYQLTVP